MNQVKENVLSIKRRELSFTKDDLRIIRSQLVDASDYEFRVFIYIAETYTFD